MKLTNSKNGGGSLSKGFAISGVLYPILILVVFLVVQMLSMLATRKMILDQNRNQLIDTMNASNQVYTNEELSTLVDGLKADTIGTIYPVGSIYISTSSKNPKEILGVGTWASFGTGRTLVGIDTSQTEFATVEKTGGEKTHTLTTSEMPSHNHSSVKTASNQNNTVIGWNDTKVVMRTGSSYDIQYSTGATGGGGAHNNLQPYITVYMWKRTA